MTPRALIRRRLCRRLAGNDHGAVAVEFALLLPVMLAFIVGIIEFGRMFWIYSTLQYAADEAGRYAMITSGATEAAVEAAAAAKVIGLNSGGATFDATESTTGGNNYMSVVITYPFTFNIPMVPMPAVTLTAQTRVLLP